MISKSHLEDLFAYTRWAHKRAYESIGTITGDSTRVLWLLNHILGAETVWYRRFSDPENANTALWLQYPPAEAYHELEAMGEKWQALLTATSEEALLKPITFTNTKGLVFTHPAGQILNHVALHGMYHRGQLATAVREAGGTPAVTDYVAYVRE